MEENKTVTTYRSKLPQLSGKPFLTDGGLETTLVFHKGIELREFAAFDLLTHKEGRRMLRDYFQPYLESAIEHKVGFILESATWRASADWGRKLGYSEVELASINRTAIQELIELRVTYKDKIQEMVVSGCIGPRGDGYSPSAMMPTEDAKIYHLEQIRILADAGADMITAMTLNYVDEAIGIVRAANSLGIPVVISFTVETDGRLPTGQTLRKAIEETDGETDSPPAYYMINCAHPSHFEHIFGSGGDWIGRIRGIRANASSLSHAELDEAETLDDGNPKELATQLKKIMAELHALNVFGGCCGTDHRHVREMGYVCLPTFGA